MFKISSSLRISAWLKRKHLLLVRQHYHNLTRERCFCTSTTTEIDFTRYTKETVIDLDRKTLQLICKALGISRGIKTTAMIKKVIEHMDEHCLSELTFFPFQNENKTNKEFDANSDPLTIKIPSEKLNAFDHMYEGKLPSVTTVLSATKSAKDLKRLELWKNRELENMDEESFNRMQQETFDSGTYLHEQIAEWLKAYHEFEKKKAKEYAKDVSCFRTKENRLLDREDFLIQTIRDALEEIGKTRSRQYRHAVSLAHVLRDVDGVLAVESGVIHRQLGYAGTVDCVAIFRDKVCLIDWKTSKRRRKTIGACYDYPVQLAAYAAAINADPRYNFKVENVAIVFVHNDSTPADVHMLSMEQCLPYYYEWQGRLKLFKEHYASRASTY